MNILELIEQLNRLGEQEKIEAKTGREVGKSILETVCAFVNEPELRGGYLLLGIQEHHDQNELSYQVVGVDHPQKLLEDLVSQCRTIFNYPVTIETEQQVIDGKVVIGIYVPEMNHGNKPIYFRNLGLPRGAFRRIGSSDVQCTEDDLLVLYENRSNESFDYTLVPDAEMDDIDPVAIEDYRRERAIIHPDAKELKWSDNELLQSLGCLRKMNGEFKPTVAGILLFGTPAVLRRLFPTIRVDYIREPGKRWVSDISNRYTAVEIRAPIMEAIRSVVSAIIDDLPKAFSLPEGSIQRKDIPALPIAAIREAVVNSLMHRNYRVGEAIQVIRYANRIEVRNPGYSLISEEHLGEPGSKSRNRKISEALHETNFAEVKGSGIRTMRESMKNAGLSPPFFESNRDRDSFVATFLFHHFLGEDDIRWLSQFKKEELSDEQARALIFVREVGAINNAAYRNLNHVDMHEASTSLRYLRDVGLLLGKNQGSATYYVPDQRLINSLATEQPLITENGDFILTEDGHKIIAEHNKDGQVLGQVLGQVFGQVLNSVESVDDLPKDLQKTVNKLEKRARSMVVEQTILALCGWREMTSDELSKLLKRDKAKLIRSYLTPMVEKGALVYKYPEMLKHPHQAYRIKLHQ